MSPKTQVIASFPTAPNGTVELTLNQPTSIRGVGRITQQTVILQLDNTGHASTSVHGVHQMLETDAFYEVSALSKIGELVHQSKQRICGSKFVVEG